MRSLSELPKSCALLLSSSPLLNGATLDVINLFVLCKCLANAIEAFPKF